MPDANVGDVLRLDRASIIGSRDFTLKGNPYIDDRLFMCRATVVSVESEPIRIKEKTKRRNRKVKKVKSKHRFTVIRVSELKINPAPVGEAMASSTVSSNAGLSAASNPGESLTAAL